MLCFQNKNSERCLLITHMDRYTLINCNAQSCSTGTVAMVIVWEMLHQLKNFKGLNLGVGHSMPVVLLNYVCILNY